MAAVDDATFIIALYEAEHARGFVRAAPSEARIRERLTDPSYEQRIVVTHREPVGFYLLRSDESWFVEAALILTVRPRFGIGTYILNEIVRRAFGDRGAHRLYVETHEDNIAMRSLLARFGFTYEGTFRHGTIAHDGAYKNLCAYGMLETDRGAVASSDGS
ncbi:MAG: hypothetical protein PVSMB8_17690 [Vulcanimicrobiaceae bacterium]